MQGIYAIYKPVGPTSHDVIDELRKITGVRSIGHAGTLDPLAQGVLVIAIGRENTKKLNDSVEAEKEYIADIKLGATSTTDDAEGEKKIIEVEIPPSKGVVELALKKFIGKIQQIPPIYSAIKMKGKKAYELARDGKAPVMEAREVEIKEIEILSYSYPDLKIRVVTGKGVYIRSLARDVGEMLATGAYLSGLQRTRVGSFTKEQSLTTEEFKKKIHAV